MIHVKSSLTASLIVLLISFVLFSASADAKSPKRYSKPLDQWSTLEKFGRNSAKPREAMRACLAFREREVRCTQGQGYCTECKARDGARFASFVAFDRRYSGPDYQFDPSKNTWVPLFPFARFFYPDTSRRPLQQCEIERRRDPLCGNQQYQCSRTCLLERRNGTSFYVIEENPFSAQPNRTEAYPDHDSRSQFAPDLRRQFP